MFDLQRAEKLTIALLTATLLLGAGITAYNRSKPASDIRVERFSVEKKAAAAPQAGASVNINEAPAEELMSLAGVGKVLARRIVDNRSSKGLFISKEDIKRVEGVGPALYDRIKDDISVE